MIRLSARARLAAVLVAGLVLGGGVVGCSASAGEPNTIATPSATGTADPNNVPADNTDYSKDAGNNPQEYEYEDELEPAESIVTTLCNLNQKFFKGLRTEVSGRAVADDSLRTNLVGLSDLVADWDGLQSHYPDSAKSIEVANQIYEKWDQALLAQDNGNEAAARTAMADAEKLIKELPARSAADCRA